MTLAILATHPVQYHAPVYRYLQQNLNVDTIVIYASDFSVAGYQDPGFGKSFAWDTDLLSGYESIFLSRVQEGGARNDREVSANGIYQALRAVNPKVILITGYHPRFHLRAYIAAQTTRVPLLFRAESIDSEATQRNPIKRMLRDLFLKQFYSTFDKILYIGQSARKHYERLGVCEDRLLFSPYCVDTTSFEHDHQARQELRTKTRASLNIADDDFVVLVSGKLILRKAPDFVLKALKSLPKDLREKLIIVFLGDGDLRDHLSNIGSSEPRLRTRFLGFKNQTELSPYYCAADVLVLASYHEPWGLVVNEALHHGIPCVVSDQVGCAPDLVQSDVTGYIFRSNSSTEFLEALLKSIELVRNPETALRCSQLAERYSVKIAAEGIASAYWMCSQKTNSL